MNDELGFVFSDSKNILGKLLQKVLQKILQYI